MKVSVGKASLLFVVVIPWLKTHFEKYFYNFSSIGIAWYETTKNSRKY